jgi:pimeloyl-ACP methyl ester carboxylesterase
MADQEERMSGTKFEFGMSYGGLIACFLAADHPDRFRRIVLRMAAHRMSDIGREIDYRYARLLSEGKPRQATAVITEALFPTGFARSLMKGIGWLIGPVLSKGTHEAYAKDVPIEAEAECTHECGVCP